MLFERSQAPLVWGCCEELSPWEVPNSFRNSCQNIGVNCTPQSEIILSGAPWSLYVCCTKSPARVCADGILGQATKWACLENRSVMTQITVFPKLSGSSTIKSMDFSPLGSGIGHGLQQAWGFAWTFFCYCTCQADGDIDLNVLFLCTATRIDVSQDGEISDFRLTLRQ